MRFLKEHWCEIIGVISFILMIVFTALMEYAPDRVIDTVQKFVFQ